MASLEDDRKMIEDKFNYLTPAGVKVNNLDITEKVNDNGYSYSCSFSLSKRKSKPKLTLVKS